MKKVKSIIFFLLFFYTTNIFSQGQNCATATPFCDAPGGAGVVFPNNTNNSSQTGPNYGCLGSEPNPAWFYFKTTVAGNYQFNLSQGTTCGAGDIDVDFICWGPFTTPYNCNNLTGSNDVDCSYSPSPTEVIDVNGAPAGQYYIILVTNYANVSGCITLALSASSPPTDCSITCPTVLSGPGIVNYPSTDPLANVPATPMPSAVACNSGTLAMYATNLAPFGNPITPGVKIEFNNNTNTSNSVRWYENGSYVGGFGSCSGCQGLTTSYDEILQFSYLSPSATNSFSFCESNTTSSNMSVSITDLTNNAAMPSTPFTWLDDGNCQTINIAPGTVKGITTWTSTCGACIAATSDWGAAIFNPAAASVGTHTITYSFNPQTAGCSTFTTSIVITVTNPYNAAFVAPGPFCAGASCATLTPSNTYTLGTGSWSGTGVSGNTFCPVTSGVGSFPVTYTIGTSSTCRATQTNTITVNAIPTANAGSTAALTCTNTSAVLSGSGGGSYSWTGPSGGISSGANTATPTVSLAGTYSLLVTVGTCTNAATVSVTQNTTAPVTSASSTGSITCTTNTINLTSTLAGASYTWTAPGGSSITSGTNSQNAVGQGSGTYTLTVKSAVNGCTSTAVTSVNQNTTAPVTSASSTGSITCTTNTINLTSTLAGASYTWTAPGGSSITSGTNSQNAVGQGSGTYTLTVQSAVNGCTSSAVTSANQNTTAPVTSASSTGSITCTTNTINLTSTLAGASYTWTAPSGSSITSGTNSQNAVGQGLGTYTLTVQSAVNGCTSTAVTSANQNTTTPVSNAGSNQTLVCGVPSVTLTGSATPVGSSANWLGGVCGSPSSFTTTACAPGTYTLVATHPVSGCTNTSTVSVNSSTNVPQATVNAVTNSITCTNSVVAIGVTLSNSDPVSYSWGGPGISGTNNTATTTATIAGTYSVTITNTLSNCQSIFNVTVPTNTTPVTANATTTASITCSTNTVNITATPTGTNYGYSWSGPGTITNGNTDSPIVNTGGNYIVTITDNTNGCSGTFTVSVPSNTTTPTFTLGTAPSVTTTCAAPNATLSGTSNADPNSIYTWTTPTSATVIGNPIVNSNPGTYSVIVTNTVNGCSTSATSPATVEVVADSGIPNITLSANSLSITCSNPTPSVTITTTASPVTYNWTPTSGIVPGTETTANPSFNAAGSYSVVVTNTASGCATTISSNVVNVVPDNTIPVISLSSAVNDGTITCIKPSINVTPTVTPNSNLTYTWSAGPGISTPINQANATFTAQGVYTLAVTNTLTGCVNTTTNSANTFTVYENIITPTVNVTATSGNTVIGCSNPIVSYSTNVNANSNNLTYTWNPGGITTPTIDINSAGIYDVTVMDAVNGCTSTAQFTVNGNTNPPQGVNAGTNVFIPCGSLSTQLNGTTTSTDVVTYDWSGPSATSISGPTNIQNPTATESGVYTLTVTNTSNGCSSTATVNVTQSTVTASISATPTDGISPLTVNFDGSGSTGATSYSWNFGDGNVAGNVNPSNIFTAGGSYTVTLIASASPCSDTATIVITVNDGLTLEIPNVFTPNGDGSNDIFTIKSTGVKEISLQIFNRWGQKLYEFTGPKASWDGKVPNGGSAPEGTYFYFVKATGFDDKEIEQNGTVNLFR